MTWYVTFVSFGNSHCAYFTDKAKFNAFIKKCKIEGYDFHYYTSKDLEED